MNDLELFFKSNNGERIHKWSHYFDIYEQVFNEYRGKRINILEIGVSHGGSLKMWRSYFGEDANIYGIDIDENCKMFEGRGIKIFIGSQSDIAFLEKIKSTIPKIDIIIDDGGHTMNQQITSFKVLFPHLKNGGVYLCEDLHTSYWVAYGGGHKRKGTFIEYSKELIDDINAWFSEQKSLSINNYTKSIKSITYFDSVVVIKKGPVNQPTHLVSGKLQFEDQPQAPNLKMKALIALNKVLRFFGIKSIILGK